MLDLNKIPSPILADLRDSQGVDATSEAIDPQLASLSPREALNMYLDYHGIIGYTDTILRAISAFGDAEVKPEVKYMAHEVTK